MHSPINGPVKSSPDIPKSTPTEPVNPLIDASFSPGSHSRPSIQTESFNSPVEEIPTQHNHGAGLIESLIRAKIRQLPFVRDAEVLRAERAYDAGAFDSDGQLQIRTSPAQSFNISISKTALVISSVGSVVFGGGFATVGGILGIAMGEMCSSALIGIGCAGAWGFYGALRGLALADMCSRKFRYFFGEVRPELFRHSAWHRMYTDPMFSPGAQAQASSMRPESGDISSSSSPVGAQDLGTASFGNFSGMGTGTSKKSDQESDFKQK